MSTAEVATTLEFYHNCELPVWCARRAWACHRSLGLLCLFCPSSPCQQLWPFLQKQTKVLQLARCSKLAQLRFARSPAASLDRDWFQLRNWPNISPSYGNYKPTLLS